MKTALAILLILLGCATPATTSTPATLLVVWDGAEPVDVRALLDRGLLPNLASVGAFYPLVIEGQTPDHPATSVGGHAQMFSGLTWRDTGIAANWLWEPLDVTQTAFAHWPYTIWVVNKTVMAYGEEDKPVHPFAEIMDASCASLQRNRARLSHDLARCVAKADGRPFLAFVHDNGADAVGSRVGAGHKKYLTSLRQLDERLGEHLRAVPSGTRVIVATDHGYGFERRRVSEERAALTPGCEVRGKAGTGRRHEGCTHVWAVLSFTPTTPLRTLTDVYGLLLP